MQGHEQSRREAADPELSHRFGVRSLDQEKMESHSLSVYEYAINVRYMTARHAAQHLAFPMDIF